MRARKKGQLKVQEMAFVLIAIAIFFAMVALVYFSIRLSSLKQEAGLQREEEAIGLARELSNVPEFSWAGCTGCIDRDKVFALKERQNYTKFWNMDYLMVEGVFPSRTSRECTKGNYPDCSQITIINKQIGIPATAYVSLCWFDSKDGLTRCDVGKISVTAKEIK